MYFTFGRHRGVHVSEVPTEYLNWCLRECECLTAWQRWAIEEELARRRHQQHQQSHRQTAHAVTIADVEAKVKTWFRRMCLRYHPDRGGSDVAMAALNDANDELRQALGLEKGSR
jgi:hypothetical protein